MDAQSAPLCSVRHLKWTKETLCFCFDILSLFLKHILKIKNYNRYFHCAKSPFYIHCGDVLEFIQPVSCVLFAIMNDSVNNCFLFFVLLLDVYLQSKFLEIDLSDQSVNAYVVLWEIANFLSIGLTPFSIPPKLFKEPGVPLPATLTYTVCCQAFEFLLI